MGDLLSPMDLVCLVIPIDKAAPKGRLILPQQQTIRDILDTGALALAVRDTELKAALEGTGTESPGLNAQPRHHRQSGLRLRLLGRFPRRSPSPPSPSSLPGTRAIFKALAEGARALDALKKGDHVLICEGCTHHRQCGDIGTVKLPALIRRHTGPHR